MSVVNVNEDAKGRSAICTVGNNVTNTQKYTLFRRCKMNMRKTNDVVILDFVVSYMYDRSHRKPNEVKCKIALSDYSPGSSSYTNPRKRPFQTVYYSPDLQWWGNGIRAASAWNLAPPIVCDFVTTGRLPGEYS